MENLKELEGVAAEFEQRNPEGDLADFLEQVALVSEQDEYDEEEGDGHPDDPPQRQGSGVRRRVHDRDGGRGVPPLPVHDRRRESWKRSAGWRTSGSPGPASACILTHAWSRSLFGGSNYNPPSRFLGEIPTDLVHSLESERGGRRNGPAGPPAREIISVTEGDTVFHDKWGEGVVVTLSGAGERTEATIAFEDVGEKRVLLAYAPLAKR